MHRLMKN